MHHSSNDRQQRGFVLVTGASRGIGAEIARCAAADGHQLVLSSRTKSSLDELADELHERWETNVKVITGDLASHAGAMKLADDIEAAGIEVQVLVNNAGFGMKGAFVDQGVDELEQMAVLNMLAPMVLTRRLLPAMIAAGSGGVLNVASVAGFQPGPGMAAYHATKSFVVNWSRGIRGELRGTGVGCTVLCPGPVPTAFNERAGIVYSKGQAAVDVPANEVARTGWSALKRRRAQAVPGVQNKVAIVASRIMPQGIVERVTAAVWNSLP